MSIALLMILLVLAVVAIHSYSKRNIEREETPDVSE